MEVKAQSGACWDSSTCPETSGLLLAGRRRPREVELHREVGLAGSGCSVDESGGEPPEVRIFQRHLVEAQTRLAFALCLATPQGGIGVDFASQDDNDDSVDLCK